MAGDALHLGELGPGAGFGVAGEAEHALTELDGLADGPGADVSKSGSVSGSPASFGGMLDPVWRLDGGEGVELEAEVGLAGGDEFVVDG